FSASLMVSSLTDQLAGGRGGRQPQLPFAHDGVDAGDVTPHRLKSLVVVELSSRRLEAQVEQLFLRLPQLRDELVVLEAAQLDRGNGCHYASPTSRVTIRHFIGSLWIARVSAARAVASFG